MDKFSAMKAFVDVAEAESFAQAARKTGRSRSQINKLVINLEDHLGVSLLNRTTRSTTLTPTGVAYLERVKGILNDLEETEALLQTNQHSPAGELKINAPMSFGTMHLSPAVIEFMQKYPKISVQVFLSDQLIDPVSNGFDMTVRIASPTDSLALVEHTIVESKRIICASPKFLEQYQEPVTVEQLRDLPCLHYGNLPSGNNWKLHGTDGDKMLKVNGVMCSNNAEILRDAAVAGMGLALLPVFIAGKDLQSGKLVNVLREYTAPPIHLSLLYPPNRHLSARVRLFVKFIQEKFGGSAYWDSLGQEKENHAD
ncbi:LysR family transcriptional regulator [Thalassomonas actiniarum]|uniref:LysR family transcriptional regulator n=1 Tax=Thalassomonas actiniarum TaxID=485447 RepID=A0AAE9YXD1_9GAMM|nr:LysR family transcriptional regulator [Thalassomonas actiniarum]WDE02150.1 LysR family transcriptional regulator [Thalassomonas actiniarum]